MSNAYDVIVVGAGPAGSICAKTLAEKEVRVLLLEKHKIVGRPLCCAEAISHSAFTSFFAIHSEWISSRISRILLVSPGKSLLINHPKAGFVLDRKIFDRDLASMAESAGAEVKMDAQAIGFVKDMDNHVSGVNVRERDRVVEYRTKIVVGADGVESQVGKWVGLNTVLSKEKIESCAQYLLEDIQVQSDCVEFHLGQKLAPGGYVWVFPKGQGRANVGVAIAPHISSEKAIDYLDRFVKYRFGRCEIREKMMGGIPAFDKNSPLVRENVLLVGDAGRIVDSLSGAGIYNAMLSGKICAEVISRHLNNGKSPISVLQEYSGRLMQEKGRELRFYAYCRRIYLGLKDSDFDLIVSFLKNYFKDEEVKGIEPISVIKAILRSNPKILLLARHLVR